MRRGGGGLGGGGTTPPAHVLYRCRRRNRGAVQCAPVCRDRVEGPFGSGASSKFDVSPQLPGPGPRTAIRWPSVTGPARPQKGFSTHMRGARCATSGHRRRTPHRRSSKVAARFKMGARSFLFTSTCIVRYSLTIIIVKKKYN